MAEAGRRVRPQFRTEADGVAAADKVDTFITAVKPQLSPIVNLTIQSDVEVISPTGGKLLNVNNAGARAAVNGAAAAQAFAGTTGAVITWRTAVVRNGRRVRGRTFLVPTVSSTFDTDGTMRPTKITELQSAPNALFGPFNGGIQLGVWARPSAPRATDGDVARNHQPFSSRHSHSPSLPARVTQCGQKHPRWVSCSGVRPRGGVTRPLDRPPLTRSR